MKTKRDRLPYTSARGSLFRLGSFASGIYLGRVFLPPSARLGHTMSPTAREARSTCGGTHEHATDPEPGRNQGGRRPLSFRLRRARANARRRGLFRRRRAGGRRRTHAGRTDHHQARHRLPPAFAPERAMDLRAQGQGARLGGRRVRNRRLTRHADLRSPQRRALGRGASRRRPGVLHREGPLARHRRHARGLGNVPFQPAPRSRTLVFLLMTKWCGSIFCSVAAMRYSSSGCRPGALTVQDTSLPSALSCESSSPMRCTPTPSFAARVLMRHAVGLDVMKASTLSRKDKLAMAPPYLSHLAMSASSTL